MRTRSKYRRRKPGNITYPGLRMKLKKDLPMKSKYQISQLVGLPQHQLCKMYEGQCISPTDAIRICDNMDIDIREYFDVEIYTRRKEWCLNEK